jgi:alkanesulfonate monooxygenase SsuD/methylene tetrahydromethanopterin reductase-like flavin-dependent oxidoreductase (luciferase family)
VHVGFGTFFQDLDGVRGDAELWRDELDLADRAERLGYDSVWAVEHHFSEYSMSPHPLQFLSWVAGRTQRVKLGSMVCVLPWHNPVRLAEEAAVLDHLSGGRLVLGIGRGLARAEFDGMGVDMAASRGLFAEHAEALLDAFDSGTISSSGRHYRQAPTPIRPRPLLPLRGRTYASSISPESAELMARLGVGVMIFLQKPWAQTVADVEHYAGRYRELNGCEPPKPLLVLVVACDRDAGRAAERFEHVQRYYRSTIDHYEFDDAALARVPGYEYYGKVGAMIARHGADGFATFLAELQPWGTPAAVAEQIVEQVRRVDAAGVIIVPSFGGMSAADARGAQALLAERVLPVLRAVDTGDDIGLDDRERSFATAPRALYGGPVSTTTPRDES